MKVTTAEIRNMLSNMGMPPNLSGFDMHAEAIYLAVIDPQITHAMTKRLYPAVAEKFGITSAQAERRMRHAVEVIFSVSTPEQIQMYVTIPVSPETGKTKNSVFISAIARYIRDRAEAFD